MSRRASSPPHTRFRWLSRIGFLSLLCFSAWLILPAGLGTRVDQREFDSRSARVSPEAGRTTARPIEAISVGDRVLAHNPEVSATERIDRPVPDWRDWVRLTLELPQVDDGSPPLGVGPTAASGQSPAVVSIELLRPESWVQERLTLQVERRRAAVPAGTLAPRSTAERDRAPAFGSLALAPLRPVYRELAVLTAGLERLGYEVLGLAIDLEMAEMGAAGTAVVTGMTACPEIVAGPGQVVTGTFAHRSSQPVLDVHFEGEPAPIGVTANHLFWSVDRKRFLAIEKLQGGERVQTYHGETKRVEQTLPRPGPAATSVHNLEVYGEQVYHVGEQGLLVHNAYAGVGKHAVIGTGRINPSAKTGAGFGVNDPQVRVSGAWTDSDLKQALLGHPPRSLGSPDIHHAGQMPGSGVHEIPPSLHRGNVALHPNRYNQGVSAEMRAKDRQLHWWYRAREQGADQRFPNWIYDIE